MGELGLSGRFGDRLLSKGMKTKKMVVIDSVEKLVETAHADTILDFFQLLRTQPAPTLVLTCRSYAIEHLRIRFLRQFPDVVTYDIPVLQEAELSLIKDKYPALETLLNKPAVKRFLAIPFNLDKAVFVQTTAYGDINSEADFRKVLWNYVTENRQREHEPGVRRRRGLLFSDIAITRARLMALYTKIKGADEVLLQQLLRNSLIEAEPIFGTGTQLHMTFLHFFSIVRCRLHVQLSRDWSG